MPSLSHPRRYENLLAACAGLPPASVAVVHPCDTSSLEGALAAKKQGIINPVLVGPKAKILQAAADAGLDIGGLPIVDAPHSDAAAEAAVALVREGRCEALMKGSLHTDELMARGGGARDRPAHRAPHQPLLRHGRAGPPRAADHHRRRGQHRARRSRTRSTSSRTRSTSRTRWASTSVRVAILSAMETVNPKVPSHHRGRGALQDGRPRPDHRRACSTGRWRSTTRSASRRRRSSTSSRRSPGAPTCWSCPTSRPATCWPRA